MTIKGGASWPRSHRRRCERLSYLHLLRAVIEIAAPQQRPMFDAP